MSDGNEKPNDDDGVILIMTVWCIFIIALCTEGRVEH